MPETGQLSLDVASGLSQGEPRGDEALGQSRGSWGTGVGLWPLVPRAWDPSGDTEGPHLCPRRRWHPFCRRSLQREALQTSERHVSFVPEILG